VFRIDDAVVTTKWAGFAALCRPCSWRRSRSIATAERERSDSVPQLRSVGAGVAGILLRLHARRPGPARPSARPPCSDSPTTGARPSGRARPRFRRWSARKKPHNGSRCRA